MSAPEPVRWPNLFVIGAQKAGTTSLHSYLSQHPDICMSSFKEPHYFSDIEAVPAWRGDTPDFFDVTGRPMKRTVRTASAYLKLFDHHRDEPYLGESSTSYLHSPEAAGRIAAASPDARAIVLLREPVSRAVSHWVMFSRERIEQRSLDDCIRAELTGGATEWPYRYLGNGLYADGVRVWLSTFPGNVLVVRTDEFGNDPIVTLDRIFGFLKIAPVAAELDLSRRNLDYEGRNAIIRRLESSDSAWRVAKMLLPHTAAHFAKRALTRPVRRDPSEGACATVPAEALPKIDRDREALRQLVGIQFRSRAPASA